MMEGILDAIFGNFLVVLAIIGGIVGFLKDRSNKDKEEGHKPYQVPKPTATPSGGGNYQSQHETTTVQTNRTTLEEQQEIQMQQLAERMNTDTTVSVGGRPNDMIIEKMNRRQGDNDSHEKKKMKKQVKRNLTGKGLVDGIIMAEVLGPPRAVKPYKSVIASRRK